MGYMYQCRLALLETLKRLRANPGLTVAVETLDDVVFENSGTPIEIIQVKHHVTRKANLTDSSSDLWKTIRIWNDLSKNGVTDAVLCLMTTAEAPEGSAAHYLRSTGRNVVMAERILLQTAQTSTSQENKDVYAALLAMPTENRRGLLESVTIVDQCPLCDDLDYHLRREVWAACHRSRTEQFLTYIEGWWYKRVLKSLNTSPSVPILGEEIDSCFDELREQFKSDALPIYDDLKTADADYELYKNHVFVHQLRLIDVAAKRIAHAVNNYYRAFEQRSRWIREELILVGDIEDYEKQLTEEWELQFETMREDLGDDAIEQEKVRAARTVYDWAEKEANIPIRQRCQELFITRGSYHILADKQDVGWHPEFRARLASILGIKESV